jgi:hypothetical protein
MALAQEALRQRGLTPEVRVLSASTRPLGMALLAAGCWLWLGEPRRAVDAAQGALARWPAIRRRGRGLQRAGLAVACAAADDPDRALSFARCGDL